MKEPETGIPTGLDRMSGLLAWWGIPNAIDANGMEARAKRFQLLAAELNTLFSDASSNQAQALSDANDQFSQAIRNLLNAGQAPELMAAQSRLVIDLMQSLAAQTQAWAELTQKLHACCLAAVCDTGAEAGDRAGLTEAQDDSERSAGKGRAKRHAQE